MIVTVVCNSAYSGGHEQGDYDYNSYSFEENYLTEVLRYDASTSDWVKTGDLQTARSSNAVSTVDLDDVSAEALHSNCQLSASGIATLTQILQTKYYLHRYTHTL